MTPYVPRFQFGDILLKDKGSPLNTLTKIKTWSDVSHSELYVGSEFGHSSLQVITAFPARGVEFYPLTLDGLVYVLRAKKLPGPEGFHWFEAVRGQGYDYLGLLSFYLAQLRGADNGKQFCSEVVARIYKIGDAPILHPRIDCDGYAPASFLESPATTLIWAKPGATHQAEA